MSIRIDFPEAANVIGTVDGAHTNATTTLNTDGNVSETVAVNDFLLINSEWVKVTAVTDQQEFTITRGVFGTTAAAHADGDEISIVRKVSDTIQGSGIVTREQKHAIVIYLAKGTAKAGTVNFQVMLAGTDTWITPSDGTYDLSGDGVDSHDLAMGLFYRLQIDVSTVSNTVTAINAAVVG